MATRKPKATPEATPEADTSLPKATPQGLGEASPENTRGPVKIDMGNGITREDY